MNNRTLRFAALAEAFVIVALLALFVWSRPMIRGVRVKTERTAVAVSPLTEALEFESQDWKFEELVKRFPDYLSYSTPSRNGRKGMSILSSCALLQKTNYVRILIRNGADVQEAIEWHRAFGSEAAAKLLAQCESELEAGNGWGQTNAVPHKR